MNRLVVMNESPNVKELVGWLWREGGEWCFRYADDWHGVRLGPDLPMGAGVLRASKLFVSFMERLPSRANPAYRTYCKMWGVDAGEKDLVRLLATIGHRGPSSFVFYAEEVAETRAA